MSTRFVLLCRRCFERNVFEASNPAVEIDNILSSSSLVMGQFTEMLMRASAVI